MGGRRDAATYFSKNRRPNGGAQSTMIQTELALEPPKEQSEAPLEIQPNPSTGVLPHRFMNWFAGRGWAPHAHQLALVDAAAKGRHALLIAPDRKSVV